MAREIAVRRALATCASVAVAVLAAAETEVYRAVDDAGHVVFTDRAAPGARPLPARRVNTYASPRVSAPWAETVAAPPVAEAPGSYDSVDIVSPTPGATVRANGGELGVLGRIVPEPRRGHRVVLSLDGRAVPCSHALGGRFSCPVTAVARGPHAMRVDVLDGEGIVAARSAVTHIHVLRAALAGGRARPGMD